MLRRRTRYTAAALAVVLAAVGLTAATAPAASAAVCAKPSTKFIEGTLLGQDRRHINAQISLNVVDAAGRGIDMNGCVTGAYTKTIWMNMNISGNGAPATTHGTTANWKLTGLPSNAVAAWIEVYTRTNTGKTCATCDGAVDTHRYGWVNRRAVKLNHSYALTAPLACGLSGGTAGTVQGSLTHAGKPVKFDRIYAWSELTPDGSKPLQGWGEGMQSRTGYYVIPTLASSQSYVVQATYKGKLQRRTHVTVKPCQNVPLRFIG
jgi:hypothetical protein